MDHRLFSRCRSDSGSALSRHRETARSLSGNGRFLCRSFDGSALLNQSSFLYVTHRILFSLEGCPETVPEAAAFRRRFG